MFEKFVAFSDESMKLFDDISELDGIPLTFRIQEFTEESARILLNKTIEQAKGIIEISIENAHESWTLNPSPNVRRIFGSWFFTATRHFSGAVTLCETPSFSTIAGVHYRQILELFLQTRYFASLNPLEREKNAKKIIALGYFEFLDKLQDFENHEYISKSYKEIKRLVDSYDKDIIDEIRKDRKNRCFYWFGKSFSNLAREVNNKNENLEKVYQINSAEIHGIWSASFDVINPKPGILDFRGYPDKTTLFIRTAELLYNTRNKYLNLWNVIAESVGARKLGFIEK